MTFIQIGIRPILESLKYINAAQSLLDTGHLPEPRYYFYLTTSIVIAFCLKTGIGYLGVAFIQLFLNFLALKTFFTSLTKIDNKSLSSLISTLFLILSIPYQLWNFYLYTESFFYSFTLLFFAYCIRYQVPNFRRILVQFIFLIFAIVSRPLGILLFPCWIFLLIIQSNKNIRPFLLASLLLSIIVLGFVSNTILGSIGDWQVLRPAEKNYVICEMPVGESTDLSHLKYGSPLNQLTMYILNYPDKFLDLAAKRWQAFFMLTRIYYSKIHNYMLWSLSLILYLPIIANCLFFFKKTFFKTAIFSFTIIISFAFIVGLQCDDYHNRFHNSIIPVFIFLGIFSLIKNSTT